MTIVVTGATGQLGRLIVEGLLANGVPASDIVAGGRKLEKLDEFAARGVVVKKLDYNDPASIADSVDGIDTLMLVSASEPGNRVPQHVAVIDAAVTAGVKRIVYTSAPAATTSALVLAPEHKATEEYIVGTGVPYTFLRNGWYTENYADLFAQASESGVVAQSAGDGKVSSASRKDYADAAVAVITGDGHENRVYELSGDTAWNFDEFAATVASLSGREVVYQRLTPEEHVARLVGFGLDEGTAGFVVAIDGNIRDGLLAVTTGELKQLIGRPTTPLAEGLATA
jgi:NAD(P)H dehydrogenase (quinone)